MSASVTVLVGIHFSFLMTEDLMQSYLGWQQVILLAELTVPGNCSDLSDRKKRVILSAETVFPLERVFGRI